MGCIIPWTNTKGGAPPKYAGRKKEGLAVLQLNSFCLTHARQDMSSRKTGKTQIYQRHFRAYCLIYYQRNCIRKNTGQLLTGGGQRAPRRKFETDSINCTFSFIPKTYPMKIEKFLSKISARVFTFYEKNLIELCTENLLKLSFTKKKLLRLYTENLLGILHLSSSSPFA